MGHKFKIPTVPNVSQLNDGNKEDETMVKFFGIDALTMYDTGATNHVTTSKENITDIRLVVDGFMTTASGEVMQVPCLGTHTAEVYNSTGGKHTFKRVRVLVALGIQMDVTSQSAF